MLLGNGSILVLCGATDLVVVLGKNLVNAESGALLVHGLFITSGSSHFSLKRVKIRVFLIYFYLESVDLFLGSCTLRMAFFLIE